MHIYASCKYKIYHWKLLFNLWEENSLTHESFNLKQRPYTRTHTNNDTHAQLNAPYYRIMHPLAIASREKNVYRIGKRQNGIWSRSKRISMAFSIEFILYMCNLNWIQFFFISSNRIHLLFMYINPIYFEWKQRRNRTSDQKPRAELQYQIVFSIFHRNGTQSIQCTKRQLWPFCARPTSFGWTFQLVIIFAEPREPFPTFNF